MDVEQLRSRMDQVQVIDVREDDEWEAGHLDGSVHIPLQKATTDLHLVDRSKQVVTVCRTGVRSAVAADLLRDAGVDVDSLDGGLQAWSEAGLPLIGASGKEGSVLQEAQETPELPPEMMELQGNLIEVAYGLQERFGNREPTDAEARSFMREWMQSKGADQEQIRKVLDEGDA